jgi:RNA polymerase sigma factor (sigma-70 family)
VLRKRKYAQSYLENQYSKEADDCEGNHRSAYNILLAELKLDVVKDALERLPEKTRIAFMLCRFEGLSYEKIAAKLGLSPQSVGYHLRRAMEQISLALEELDMMDG